MKTRVSAFPTTFQILLLIALAKQDFYFCNSGLGLCSKYYLNWTKLTQIVKISTCEKHV